MNICIFLIAVIVCDWILKRWILNFVFWCNVLPLFFFKKKNKWIVRLADVDAADDPSDELSQLRYADDDDDDDDNGDMGDNDEEEESRRSSTTSDANKSTKANSK